MVIALILFSSCTNLRGLVPYPVEPGAGAQVLQYIFYRAEGRLGRCEYPSEIDFLCRCSLTGDIRETLETVKGRE